MTEIEEANRILASGDATPDQLEWAFNVPGSDTELFWASTQERQKKEREKE